MRSVLQDWVMDQPLRLQGTLLTAIRGCDDEPKQWSATGFADSPGRRLTAFLRFCVMHPADPREVDIPGAFFQSTPPAKVKPSEFGHLPQHWYSHIMHSFEVIGFRHPDPKLRAEAYSIYERFVRNLHLWPENEEEMLERLTEDRIANDSVVS